MDGGPEGQHIRSKAFRCCRLSSSNADGRADTLQRDRPSALTEGDVTSLRNGRRPQYRVESENFPEFHGLDPGSRHAVMPTDAVPSWPS